MRGKAAACEKRAALAVTGGSAPFALRPRLPWGAAFPRCFHRSFRCSTHPFHIFYLPFFCKDPVQRKGFYYGKDRGKTREGAWPRAPRALRSAAIPPIYYFWGEPRYARAHPRPDGLFLLPHTPSTCDSAPVGRHVRNRGESACSSASRSATGGHGKPRRTRPVPDHPVRGFSTAA